MITQDNLPTILNQINRELERSNELSDIAREIVAELAEREFSCEDERHESIEDEIDLHRHRYDGSQERDYVRQCVEDFLG